MGTEDLRAAFESAGNSELRLDKISLGYAAENLQVITVTGLVDNVKNTADGLHAVAGSNQGPLLNSGES